MSHSGTTTRGVATSRPAPTSGKLANSTWFLPIVGAMIYPLLIEALFASAEWASGHSGMSAIVGVLGAVASGALALLVPALALRNLMTLRKSKAPSARRVRMILHFVFAGPPLYILMGIPAAIFALTIAGSRGAAPEQQIGLLLWWRDAFWWGVWVATALLLAFGTRSARQVPAGDPPTPPTRDRLSILTPKLRLVHRYAVLVVVLAFLTLHLGNHLVALWSIEAQDTVMRILRLWYRAPGIEPAILTIFAVGVVVGIFLVVRWARSPGDGFRVLQTSSGFYLALFLMNHTIAVFRNRSTGKDTDWAFATGGDPGMLGSEPYVAVFLYYVLAVLLVGVHVGTGLRMALLTRGVDRERADRVVIIMSAGGAVVAGLTAAALLGLRLGEQLN